MFDTETWGELAALFFSALGAATLIPGVSEAVLVGVLTLGDVPVWQAITVASIGNTLGSVINWVLGRFFSHWLGHKYFPISREKFERLQGWYSRWGVWTLLTSWAPIIGDPITVVAGIMRTPLWLFVLIVAFAKTARYILVALGVAAVG
ncbi:YqaA family protein [Tepidamorphus sp. 3E244]|uniref:YqaA family protein n=1 Tax=Tepidamorphus sp. 3E244 TaxID=3385498 RepID=UPI0038FCEA40